MRALAIGLALSCATPAVAKTPRFTRPDPVVTVTLTDRVKPMAFAPTTVPAPTAGWAEVEALLGAPVGALDGSRLATLESRTPDQIDPSARPGYYYELATEHDKHAHVYRLRAADAQARADREPDQRKKAKLLAEAARDASQAKDHLLKGVKAYRVLVDNGAMQQFPGMDTALFRYGYLLQSFKYMKEARDTYDRLLKNFPNSKFVPAAHLAFAEYYFEANQLADAEARYKMVLKFPKSDVYYYASYKLGWVHFRLQRFQEALESFFMTAIASKTPALEPLGRAAKLDFVRAYAEIGKADKAYAAFQRVDRTMAFEMLDALGAIYFEEGKLDRAIYIQQELMKQAPTDARVCTWQHRIARGLLSMPGATVADKVSAVEGLAKLDAALEAKGTLPAPAAQECRANAIAMSTELGRAFHSEALKTRNAETLLYATRLYQTYLDNFPTDPARGEHQLLAAEALWAQASVERNNRVQAELFERAAAAFTAAAKVDRVHPSDEHKAAAYAWLDALDDKYSSIQVPTTLTMGTPPPVTALSQRELDAIAAFDAFAAAVNNLRDPDLGTMRFVQAKILTAANQHAQAARIYASLYATHAGAGFSEAAAVLAIDSMVLAQRIDELLLFADRLNADAPFLSDKADLERIVKYVRSHSMRR